MREEQEQNVLHRKERNVVSPLDSILSLVHLVKVHVFSDSVLFFWQGAMSEASRKFNNQVVGQSKYSGSTTSRRIHSKFLSCSFHVYPGAISVQLLVAIQTTVSSTRDAVGNGCTPETYST